jgi:hypothetical protein
VPFHFVSYGFGFSVHAQHDSTPEKPFVTVLSENAEIHGQAQARVLVFAATPLTTQAIFDRFGTAPSAVPAVRPPEYFLPVLKFLYGIPH